MDGFILAIRLFAESISTPESAYVRFLFLISFVKIQLN